MGILFFIFFIILLIFLVVISIVFGFLRSLFGFKWFSKQAKSSNENYSTKKNRSKVFDTSEGEYTDYEEIK